MTDPARRFTVEDIAQAFDAPLELIAAVPGAFTYEAARLRVAQECAEFVLHLAELGVDVTPLR